MSDQFVLITYDISNDRRRTKLHKTLLNYGTPVQYSVFECLLNEANEKAMRRAVQRVIRPRQDHIRFYYLCANCLKRVETTAGQPILSQLPAAIVVG